MMNYSQLSKQLDSLVNYRIAMILSDREKTSVGYTSGDYYIRAVLKSVGENYVEVWEYVRQKHYDSSSGTYSADETMNVWKLLIPTERIVFFQFWDDKYFELPTVEDMTKDDDEEEDDE